MPLDCHDLRATLGELGGRNPTFVDDKLYHRSPENFTHENGHTGNKNVIYSSFQGTFIQKNSEGLLEFLRKLSSFSNFCPRRLWILNDPTARKNTLICTPSNAFLSPSKRKNDGVWASPLDVWRKS